MKLGRFEISAFVEQHFKLDGGTMFGVIPRTMWSKLISPDENNLIPMRTNLFILKAHGKNIIFDAGLGDTLSDREKKIYGTDGCSMMTSGLKENSLNEADIDFVVLTHLHTDHVGGAVKFDKSGNLVPRFPRAKVIVSEAEWNVAMNPDERTSAVYVPERLKALDKAGQIKKINPDTELWSGIKAVYTGGHSTGHFGLEIESEGEKLFYYADIFPSAAHLSVAFIPATDLDPMQSMNIKREKIKEIVDDNVILAFDHDNDLFFARVERDGKKYIARSA